MRQVCPSSPFPPRPGCGLSDFKHSGACEQHTWCPRKSGCVLEGDQWNGMWKRKSDRTGWMRSTRWEEGSKYKADWADRPRCRWSWPGGHSNVHMCLLLSQSKNKTKQPPLPQTGPPHWFICQLCLARNALCAVGALKVIGEMHMNV